MEMLGEVKGYCGEKSTRVRESESEQMLVVSTDHTHLLTPAGGKYTCWSRVKVRVSRTNWETESSAVEGCRTRLTSQALEDTTASRFGNTCVKIKATANNAALFQVLVFQNCTQIFPTRDSNLQPELIKQSNLG